MAKKVSETELKALLGQEIAAADAYDRSELAIKRTKALEYVNGKMLDTPALPNRSSVVSRDVADTIGRMLPGIIRVFTASDRMVDFEPERPGDEQFADQAGDYANYCFFKENPGYRTLWNATHDALVMGNGIVKHWFEDKEECDYAEYTGLTVEQIALLEADGLEIVSQKPGQPQEGFETFDIKTKRVTSTGRIRIEAIEPENFLMDDDARTIEEARFTAHRSRKTRSDLIEMGFARKIVESLPVSHGLDDSQERYARDPDHDWIGDTAHRSMQLIDLFECYVRLDMNGDGIAETVRAFYAGDLGSGELLDWEIADDDCPFSDIPCEPVPHRWEANSIFDETADIQRIRTVLTRQLLDNLYAHNNPMTEAEAGTVVNPEMLVSPKFGGVIWRKPGTSMTAPIKPFAIPFTADKVLPAIQYLDEVLEKRTGVSRSTMALDPETLSNQTATAVQAQKDASYSQVEMIARNMAELGWKRVFRQILRLAVKHQDRPRVIRLRDEWVEMDPRYWNSDMDVTIRTGLGTGTRDRDMAMLKVVLEGQVMLTERLAQGGFMDRAVEMMPKIITTMKRIAESAGLKNADSYYPDIGEQDLPALLEQAKQMASQPDPKVQIEQEKLRLQAQKDQAEMALKERQMQGELALKERQIVAEMDLKERQLVAELALKERMGMVTAATSRVTPGGEPG